MYATTCFVLLVTSFLYVGCDNWQEWWTYDGISGPGYWGLMNPQWNMCSKGRRQSPINVEPDKLLFDPYLRHIHLDKHKVSGTLHNTGQSLVFRVDKDTKQHVNISGGPLAYRYQFEEIYIHYGVENNYGSEHYIHGYSFPAEIQLYGFNKELYHNMSEAQHKSQGIVGISLMVQIGDMPNPELRIITSVFNKVQYKGDSTPIKHLSLRSMLPDTEHFMTYEGSTTHPGCWETTVWIIFNKPIYITKHELYQLRKLMQGSVGAPKAPLGNNARPVQPLHQRTIRTNINFRTAERIYGIDDDVVYMKQGNASRRQCLNKRKYVFNTDERNGTIQRNLPSLHDRKVTKKTKKKKPNHTTTEQTTTSGQTTTALQTTLSSQQTITIVDYAITKVTTIQQEAQQASNSTF